MYRRLLAPGLLLLLAACAQDPSVTSNTVRICDDTGCSHRPKDQVSYQNKDDAEDREDPRIAALKQAAKAQPKAAYDLGLRYFRGDGVRQDSYQALKWMRDAAERGDLRAQKALGGFYLFGLEEMGSDPREAEKWLSIAAGRGDKESKRLLELARKAKKEDEEDWKWRTQWRDVYYGYWYSGYPYYGVWNQTYWYY
ncbi:MULTISPECIES: tetratricopeptide repeat protein [Burkholderia]|uniref:Sel1 domain protein repeat-containing protein n=1 Tax=Burkholderia ambifaria (strain MC40-6) TaxID=398577 RepID=B1YYR5_BURA4|nr:MULTISPECIES: SEL1-like repeat protein [Burkholderia]ACB65775.1 Sel1 domain protein repeat-containing protein [Burkholderia ambifaria MC40-6]MBR8174567.1 sel1 repeat family protein [Burkholderia ambifaria]MBR8253497.1 sel1 repeat family protein [Burkholderia ambifaria]QDW54122.1 sel1 repeat family protein [Burkholderia sp. KBS0801]